MKQSRTFAILIWASKSVSPSSLSSLYARLTLDGKRAEISLQRKVNESRWDSTTGRVKGSSTEIMELNNYLNQVKVKLFAIYNKMLTDNEFVTPEAIKNEFNGKAIIRRTLLKCITDYNDDLKRRVGLNITKPTYVKFCTVETKVNSFVSNHLRKKDIYLEQLNYSFVTEFEYYLRSAEKINSNTAMKYIRMLKQVMNDAVRRNWLLKNPFAQFKCTFKWPDREVLTSEEIELLIKKELKIERIAQVRDYFVFSCFTGLSYIDMVNLHHINLIDGMDGKRWLAFIRHKTQVSVKVPILPQAQRIIDRYVSNRAALSTGRVFPSISNQKMNSYLKEIADLCNIKKTLTYHIARHTFATTVTLANGVPIESVSKMLGHSKMSTTQIYSKVIMKKLSEDMENLEQRLRENASKSQR